MCLREVTCRSVARLSTYQGATCCQLPVYPGVQVNGDSGNDIELFEVPGVRGCVVANAHPELRQFAEAAVAAGNTNIALATQPCAGECAL